MKTSAASINSVIKIFMRIVSLIIIIKYFLCRKYRQNGYPGNCSPPPVTVRAGERLSVGFRVGGQFSSEAIALEPAKCM